MGLRPWEDILRERERFDRAKVRLLATRMLQLSRYLKRAKAGVSPSLDFSERSMVRKMCGSLQTCLAVLPNSFFLSALLVRSLLDPPEFLHYPNDSSSRKKNKTKRNNNNNKIKLQKTHHQRSTTRRVHFGAFRPGMKKTSGRESCRFALPPNFQKTCHEKVWISVIGSLAQMHHPLFHSRPPPFLWMHKKQDDQLSRISLRVPKK